MTTFKNNSLYVTATCLLVASGSAWAASPGATHSVGGTITGLQGTGLVLRLNGQAGDAYNIGPSSGAVRFAFKAALATGSIFVVTVKAQPVGPSQICAVKSGETGKIGAADVASVAVACTGSLDAGRPSRPWGMEPRAWDIYVDAFNVVVDVDNITYKEEIAGGCGMSGGKVSSVFRESPSARDTPVTSIQWDPQRRQPLGIEFKIDSDATVGPQYGTLSTVPRTCSASSDRFKDNTYRMVGEMDPNSPFVTMTSPMPENADTTGNHGCPGNGGGECSVQYWFDNSPGTARTTFDLDRLLTVGSLVIPIRGSAKNVSGYRERRTGDYTWSGAVTLRAVPVKP